MRYIFLFIYTVFNFSSCKTANVKSEINAQIQCGFADELCEDMFNNIETDNSIFLSQLSGGVKREWLNGNYKQSTAKLKLIKHNTESWYARWKMIKEAKKSIDITYFIIEKDIFGKALVGALHEKLLKDGIKLRIMMDAKRAF